ncbi:MAG: sialidase family protein [Acidimicrobiales bacterium]
MNRRPNSNRRRALRAGAGLGLLALVAGQAGAFAADQSPVRVTKSYNATGDDLAPTRTYSAPHMAVDPEDPMRIVASTPEFRTKGCRMMITTNGGQNWRILDSTPSPQSYPFCMHTSGTAFQTQIAFGREGAIYYALSGYDNNDLTPAAEHGGVYGSISVLLARSTDNGENWQTSVVRSTRGQTDINKLENNRPVTGLAVDRRNGDQDIVYVAWRRGTAPGATSAPSQSMLGVSTDGGRTFGEPIVMGDAWNKTKPESDKWGGSNPTLGVAEDGSLYGAYFGSTTVTPAPQGGSNAIVVVKTTDRGKTWTAAEAAAPSPFYGPLLMNVGPGPTKAGTVHLVYEHKVGPTAGLSDRDIYYQRSTDGGKTFSELKRINDDDPQSQEPGGGHVQTNPNITIAPNGRVDAAWWDFRNDTGGFTNDVYYAYSNDNGATWSKNIRVSDRSIDRRLGIWSNGYDMRTPPGIASTNSLAVFAWDDTRNTIKVGDGQDVFAGVVQFSAVGDGGSTGARYALAALGGVTLVGLILLGISFAAKGRSGPAVRAGAGTGAAPKATKVDTKK